MIRYILIASVVLAAAAAFECPADTILRLATNHRSKDLEAECHRSKTNNACSNQKDADEAWAAFEKVQTEYKKAVAECVAVRKSSKVRRSVPNAEEIAYNPSGHHHKRRHVRSEHSQRQHHKRNIDALPYSEPERQQISRSRRQVCSTKGKETLDKMQDSFKAHCDRENICLPDEDLPEGAQRNRIKEIQGDRAKKYTTYLSHVSMCNA